MIKRKQGDAAKLYVVLRGLALLPQHVGTQRRRIGLVPRSVEYADLHDICRQPHAFTTERPHDYEPTATDLKRKRQWTRRQLARLENYDLLRRVERPGRSLDIVLLDDRGTGEPLDDPTGKHTSYVTLHGTVVSSPEFREWGGPQLIAYICAMQAGRRAAHKAADKDIDPADAEWFQSAEWFTTSERRRPDGHVLYPTSVDTIQRGLRFLEKQGWIESRLTRWRPDNGARMKHPRKVYTNQFSRLETMADIVDLAEQREARTDANTA